MGVVSICVVLSCLAAQNSRGLARETEGASLLPPFKEVRLHNTASWHRAAFSTGWGS